MQGLCGTLMVLSKNEDIKNELKSTMILTGCQSIKDIDSKVIYNY